MKSIQILCLTERISLQETFKMLVHSQPLQLGSIMCPMITKIHFLVLENCEFYTELRFPLCVPAVILVLFGCDAVTA